MLAPGERFRGHFGGLRPNLVCRDQFGLRELECSATGKSLKDLDQTMAGERNLKAFLGAEGLTVSHTR